jgi:predicted nucleotidyltransferase
MWKSEGEPAVVRLPVFCSEISYNPIMVPQVAIQSPLSQRKRVVMPRTIRKVLRELKKGLLDIYGEQLSSVYLFGSYARGEGRPPHSDIDVMIVLKGKPDYHEAQKRSSGFIADLCLEHDVVISWFFSSDMEYVQSRMPFMITVRQDAVAI